MTPSFTPTMRYSGWGRPPSAPTLRRSSKFWNAAGRSSRDNALYPLLKARLLLAGAVRHAFEEQRPVTIQFRYTNLQGREFFWDWTSVEITDPQALKQALATLHEAAAKPSLFSHVAEFAKRRAAVLPEPTRVSDRILQDELTQPWGHTLSQYGDMTYGAVQLASSWAAAEAESGQAPEALQTAEDLRRITRLAVQDARLVSEMQSASRWSVAALYLQAMVLQKLNMSTQFEATLTQIAQQRDAVKWLYTTHASTTQQDRQAGMIDMKRTWYLDMDRVDLSPGRRADYAVLDRAALAFALVFLTASATLIAAWTVVRRLRTGRWPMMAFLGWRRLVKVVLLSTLVPLGIYAAYAWFTPLSARSYGTQASLERVLVEYAAIGCAIALLLRILSAKALRQRAAELGTSELQAEPPPRFWRALLQTAAGRSGLLLAAALVTYLVALALGGDTLQYRALDGHGWLGVPRGDCSSNLPAHLDRLHRSGIVPPQHLVEVCARRLGLDRRSCGLAQRFRAPEP